MIFWTVRVAKRFIYFVTFECMRGRRVRGGGAVAVSSELCGLDFELSDKRRLLLTLFICPLPF